MYTRDDERRAFVRVAKMKHALGDLVGADHAYREILKDDATDTEILFSFACLKFQKKEFKIADDVLDTLIARHGGDPDTHYLKALIAALLGSEMHARNHIRSALAGRPDFVECHQMLCGFDMKGPDYRRVLAEIHGRLKPVVYVEIGVDDGGSLALAKNSEIAIGIDPDPQIVVELADNTEVCRLESDAFFAGEGDWRFGDRPISLSFVDGLHEAKQALRDVLNCEKHSTRESVILMHDVVPLTAETAAADRQTLFWTGNVWKVLPALTEFFSDLSFCTLVSPPSGLAVIRDLKPDRAVGTAELQDIYEFIDGLRYEDIAERKTNWLRMASYDSSELDGLLGLN